MRRTVYGSRAADRWRRAPAGDGSWCGAQELDRMLAAFDPVGRAPSQPRISTPRRPVLSRPLSGEPARKGVDPEEVRKAVTQIRESGAIGEAAVKSSDAPPELGFVGRLLALADASEQQADAPARAGSVPGVPWTPLPDGDAVLSSWTTCPRPGRAALVQRSGV